VSYNLDEPAAPWIRAVIESAPPLDDEAMSRIRALLPPLSEAQSAEVWRDSQDG
jgi:hypothetical protein